MAKIRLCDNYRVVITPESLWMAPDNEVIQIRDQVLRHVDVSKRAVSIEFDDRWVCSFCNKHHPEWVWEEGAAGEPLCCDQAIEEWKSQQASPGF